MKQQRPGIPVDPTPDTARLCLIAAACCMSAELRENNVTLLYVGELDQWMVTDYRAYQDGRVRW